MRGKQNRYLTLLLILTLVSLISLVSDKDTMGFYQLNALSLSSFSSLPLPAINQTTIIIAVSILLVIIVILVVIRLLRRKTRNSEGEEILAQAQAQTIGGISMDSRLAQYVREARAAGLSNEIISQKLRDAGWLEETIKQAL